MVRPPKADDNPAATRPNTRRMQSKVSAEKNMANKQLEGRIFNREGTNYMVLEGNDWNSETVKVKTVDARRNTIDMPLKLVLRCVGDQRAQR